MARPRSPLSGDEPRGAAGGLVLSRHAASRARQRGFRASDLELVAEFGTPTATGTVLRRRDVDALRASCARLLARLDRLAGTALVVQESTVVTVYRASRAQRRRQLSVAA